MQEAVSAKSLFHSGGGVTLSGGEPTMQFDGSRDFLEALRSQLIDTAMETNGTHARLPELFPFINTLIIDMKHHDDGKSMEITGSSMEKVRVNIRAAAENDVKLIVRITLIPGFNSSAEDIRSFADLLAPIGTKNISIELLMFHEYGTMKWAHCGKEYHFRPSAIAISRSDAEKIFIERGITIVHT